MFYPVINSIKGHLKNIPGWRTNRKIVVIESDDWGSIRMPSSEVFRKCKKAGYKVDQNAYERFDSLASEDDLELLFNVLTSVKDFKGNHPVITANSLVANPDFHRIKKSKFEKYYYETILDTFQRYPRHSNCFSLWRDGFENGVFYPQSHGREHLNVSLFMKALQQGDKDVHFGFNHEMPGCIPQGDAKSGNKYVEALLYKNQKDKEEKISIIIEGLELFKKLFGYRSESFTPPNYIWSPEYDKVMSSKGVRFYQVLRKTREPLFEGSFKLHSHRLGKENKFGQKYLVRNATFEPAFNNAVDDSVSKCLKDISIAFRMNKPAIICSHRLNYVGFIDENNRDKSLKLLKNLLCKIQKKWPEVEFLNSVQIGKIMSHENGGDL